MPTPKDIAEFARNEMIRADHTIGHASEVVPAKDAASFKVTSCGKSFIVCVLGEAEEKLRRGRQ